MSSRQLESGAFTGDEWGEEDTRFLYCSVSALSHLNALDRLDQEKTVNHILRCENFDGGFGTGEGGESHAAQGESRRRKLPLAIQILFSRSRI